MAEAVTEATHKPRGTARGLNAASVKQMRKPGRYGDGNGLYLIVDPPPAGSERKVGAARWVLRVQAGGKRRDVGLGGAKSVTLAEARDLAHEIRRKAKSGQDPVAARRREREGMPTFEALATTVHKARLATWRNGKHTAQWLATLEAYAFPILGKLPVNRVETGHVLKVLMPIWTAKPETARRVLQRIGNVLDHATAAGHRSGENPCRMASIGLPKQGHTVRHFTALPYAALPGFIVKLRDADSAETIRLALEFLILTAARSGEVRGATRDEFDTKAKLWTIPAQRMKAEREHVVPLSSRAIEIVQRAIEIAPDSGLLFPTTRSNERQLSDMALTMMLRRLKIEATAHGFRSTFRDWVSEETDFPGEVAEMALAHAIGSKVEAAYRRGKLLEKRRELMKAWANFVVEGKPT
jgi:integrase